MFNINSVKDFWEDHPLWIGKSVHESVTLEFFVEHRSVYRNDCFAGSFDNRFLPPVLEESQQSKILDLDCGIGFWVSEFSKRGLKNLGNMFYASLKKKQ